MTKMLTNLVFFGIICLIGVASGQNLRDKEKGVKDQIFGRSYDATMLPSGTNNTGPVNVNVSVVVKNIMTVDDSNMNMDVQLILALEWNDPRLAYTVFPPNSGLKQITLSSSAIDKVWLPDIYIVNAVNFDVTGSNKFMQIFPTGDIKYSFLMTAKINTPMSLSYYPHDIQNCFIKISTYGYSANDLKFSWKDTAPVNVASDIQLSKFVLESITNEICDSSTSKGTYSCLKVGLALKRECQYYVIQVYIPCCMLVIMSWLTYWLHPIKTATGRLVLSIITLGLAVIGCGTLNSMTPKVSYTKAIDVWTGTCLTFIFLSLIEFVILNYLNQYRCSCTNVGKNKNAEANSSEHAEQQTPLHPSGEDKGRTHQEGSVINEPKLTALIDVGFRIGIPVLFLLFMIIYWIAYV